jgi:hypothetical protein
MNGSWMIQAYFYFLLVVESFQLGSLCFPNSICQSLLAFNLFTLSVCLFILDGKEEGLVNSAKTVPVLIEAATTAMNGFDSTCLQ